MSPAFGPSWAHEVRDRGVLAMAQFLGLETGRRGPRSVFIRPCPACGTQNRHQSTHDKRGAVGVRPDDAGWQCHNCKETGDALNLASLKLFGTKRCGSLQTLREGLRDYIATPQPVRVAPPPKAAARPLPDELARLWGAGVALTSPGGVPAAAYLSGRGIRPDSPALHSGVVRVLPASGTFDFPAWWPAGWANTWRIAVPAYDAHGTMVSLHARAIRDGVQPKTRWPLGMDAGGLFFADALGLTFLQNWQQTDATGGLEAIVITEGLTDTLAMAEALETDEKTRGVIGIASGSIPALGRIRWPDGVGCWVATDHDKAGDAYASAIRAVLPGHVVVERVNPKSLRGDR